jgi:hypothetical protein
MRYAINPRQKALFDPAESMFSPMTIKCMLDDWPAVFRQQLLHLMPVEKIGKHFHPILGTPTKELYGMVGAIFLKEFFNLTIEQTVQRYLTDLCWQYALNVSTLQASMSHSSVERYMRLFAEDDVAADVFDRVTTAMVEALELDVSLQRLDSTHVFSDMAQFGRTRLMGVTIRRFLVQLKRHHPQEYAALPEVMRERYQHSKAQMFADHQGSKEALRQSVSEQLYWLVQRFADHAQIAARTTYQHLRRVFQEQCDVAASEVALKKKVSCEAMQNPSDPEATYDGHKGPGYQAQIVETCSQQNDAQLITGVAVEPAHASDQESLEPMLDQLSQQDRLPETLCADAGYGRDENVLEAEARGVDLQSPVGGTAPQNPQDLTVDDFVIDEQTEEVQRCPAGHPPLSTQPDPQTGWTVTVMAKEVCGNCAFQAQCPVVKRRRGYVLRHTPLQRRSAARRAEQATEVFRERYRIRAGGESTNSGLKRRTGMGRLRTRGLRRMRMGVLLRCAGWNLMQAVRALKHRAKAAGTSLAGVMAILKGCSAPHHGLMAASRWLHALLSRPFAARAMKLMAA